MYNIIVVEDEQEITDLVALYLRNENYTVHRFYSGSDAVKFIDEAESSAEIDLAILDIMLPDVNGFTICQHIREKHTYPIIMLTAKDEEVDKITGLSFGADDYITKPFRPLELVARVKAQLRRYKTYNRDEYRHANAAGQDGILAHLGLMLNSKTHECTLNEKPLVLTPTEFNILRILLEHKDEVVSAEGLFHEIWQDEYYSKSNNTVTVHIRHLREKMTWSCIWRTIFARR